MPITLRVGELPNANVVGFASQVRGLPFACYKVEAQVVSDDDLGIGPRRLRPPPVPAGSGTDELDLSVWAEVTGSASLGAIYYPENEDLGAWIPSETTGTGRIRYRVRAIEAVQAAVVERSFEALQGIPGFGIPVGGESNYCTLADLGESLVQAGAISALPWADEGEPTEADEAMIRGLLRSRRQWRALIERICRQRFRLVAECRQFQGEGSPTLLLPEPLFWGLAFLPGVATSEIEIVRAVGPISDPGNLFDLYSPIVNVRGAVGADRRNPSVELLANPATANLGPFSTLGPFASSWEFGLSSTIWGLWGFVDEDSLDCPAEIRTATIRGVLLSNGYDLSVGGGGPAGPVRRERTDSHEIEWAVQSGALRGGLLSILRDPAIRDALDLYRAPIGIAAGYGGL